MPRPIDVYDGLNANDQKRILEIIEAAIQRATAPPDEPEGEPSVVAMEDLIGIDPEVYRQINAALATGHRHLLFYGPPGTGKTTLAQWVAEAIADEWRMITGSSDWTSQDIIGGYHPLAGGGLVFMPGILLSHFDKPLIFDELNRCDIDKVIGPLFTVLSGQGTTLPYLSNPADPDSPRIEILPQGQPDPPRAYAPTTNWRLLATINSLDKASLYQMSYALTRRFAWIYIDVPADPSGFIREYLARATGAPSQAAGPVPLGRLWEAVNKARAVGPAPILDIIRLIRARDEAFNFFQPVGAPEQADPYLDGFYVYLLPMLDGIQAEDADRLGAAMVAALNLGESARATRLRTRIGQLAL